MDSCIKGSK